ncbi:MAG: alpha/beta hydrolase [Dehalococcoidia bacterium]|nr:alpha/beta hydrolase [Dehalococcoidia bacterium]
MNWEEETLAEEDLTLSLNNVQVSPGPEENSYLAVLETSRGNVNSLLHPIEGGSNAIICVGGANGGLNGPAHNLYTRLPLLLEKSKITVLRIDYREPNHFAECVLDVLAGCSFLKGIGAEAVILMGHSFGGGVVVSAARLHALVHAVISLSPQRFGTALVSELNMPLLLVHGTADKVLPCEASKDIFERANEPKQLLLYQETGHSLTEARLEIDELIPNWIVERFSGKEMHSGKNIETINQET